MVCPICGGQMEKYKEQPSYSEKKQIEYRRSFYRCEKDDTWGRFEVPVGPMSQQDAPAPQHSVN